MRTYRLAQSGVGLDLALREEPDPRPGQLEVVVRVRAASLNYRDMVMRRGQYGGMPDGKIPLSDGAGVVIEVGEDVTRVKRGDRVAGAFMQRWISGPPTADGHRSALGGDLDGMLTEKACLNEAGLVRVPDYLTDEEAACLPCAAVTVWHGLIERGRLQPGQTVLVLGSGGVSVFAAQIAQAAGARVIATSGSNEKITKLHALGFADTINYKETPDWDKAVKALTAGRGVDHVVEVGGGGTIDKSLKSVAVGGHIAQIGVVAGREGAMNPFAVVLRNVTISGIYVGSREHFEKMNAFFSHHQIRPVIDRVFPFEDAAAAYAWLEGAHHVGKVVIRV
jgi:NADPH:quinone reductase-like Zn-dependent oxidoreductase